MKLIIENIRSFAGKHTVEIKPLTLLVGENSSGKSTLLAALAALSDRATFPGKLSFNKEPYNLGAYRTVATCKSAKIGRAKSFSIGFTGKAGQLGVFATYTEAKGDSALTRLKINNGDLAADLSFDEGKMTGVLRNIPSHSATELQPNLEKSESSGYEIKLANDVVTSRISISETLPGVLYSALLAMMDDPQMRIHPTDLYEFTKEVSRFVSVVCSIAPVRSKPRRVYDRSNVGYEPGGDHIPYILAQLLNDDQNKQREQLSEALNKFGEQSGLFKKIAAPILGAHQGDPFEIEVSIAGPATNLLDVGYGVSQSLPIIVESLLAAPSTRLLVQQPEVHLHPKAQAALGSFLADMVRDGKRQFVVETHSDYIIDRIRQEVAAGRLPAESVAIVYLEKTQIETTVHQLKLDEAGNILNAPPTYRAFFMEEEMNLLNRAP